jgi:hypothetical protein
MKKSLKRAQRKRRDLLARKARLEKPAAPAAGEPTPPA